MNYIGNKFNMKILVTENQINRLVSNYLDSQDWKVWDEGDGEFNVSDGKNGRDYFKYRIQYSSTVPDLSFQLLYIDDDLVRKVDDLFNFVAWDSVESIIEWFNKKYDKKLTKHDFEWMSHAMEYDIDDEVNESVIKEQYDSSRLYPKQEILRLLKNAPIELRQIAKKLPNIPCENDKGERTICTKIPETIHVYLTGRY